MVVPVPLSLFFLSAEVWTGESTHTYVQSTAHVTWAEGEGLSDDIIISAPSKVRKRKEGGREGGREGGGDNNGGGKGRSSFSVEGTGCFMSNVSCCFGKNGSEANPIRGQKFCLRGLLGMYLLQYILVGTAHITGKMLCTRTVT